MVRRGLIITVAAVLLVSAWPVQGQQPDMESVVDDNTAFAFDLYHTLGAGNDSNLFFSPYSISTALAMTYAGARGTTEQQMADVMHFTLPQDQLHPAFGELQQEIGSTSAIANALWGQSGYPFRQEYLDLVNQNYSGGLQQLDFKTDPEAARQTINRWVSDRTEKRIEDLIPQDALDTSTRLVLTNAIYFKQSWSLAFDAGYTGDGAFTLLDGSTVTVPTMSQTENFGYAEGDGFQAIKLDYIDNRTAMLIILPGEGRFAGIESGLDTATFKSILESLADTEVMLSMPRFEYTSGFSLGDMLKTMGMTDAFDPVLADFSGMADAASIGENVFISAVFHKAFVKVDETGTEAAAATAVVEGATAAQPGAVMRINRPFIYLIIDQQTGSVLFMGRVMNPAG
jgi:serpin B